MLRILPGPQNSPSGAPAEITVLDPSHPEAPLHAAEALVQLPGTGCESSPLTGVRPGLAGLPGVRAQAGVWRECSGVTAAGCLVDPLQPSRDIRPCGAGRVSSGRSRRGRPAVVQECRPANRTPAVGSLPPQQRVCRSYSSAQWTPGSPTFGKSPHARTRSCRGIPTRCASRRRSSTTSTRAWIRGTSIADSAGPARRRSRASSSWRSGDRELLAGAVPQHHCGRSRPCRTHQGHPTTGRVTAGGQAAEA